MSSTQAPAGNPAMAADRPRIAKRRVFIYAMLFAMTAVNYTDRVNLSVAGGLVSHEFGLSPADLGWLLSAHLWPYIICLAPAGMFVDWIGYRLAGWLAVGFWSLCTIATALIRGPVAFYATRIGLGGAEAANFPIGTQAVRAWAPRPEYGVAVASLSLGQWFGTAFGAMFVGWVVRDFGWRAAFVLTGVLGLVWVAIWLLFVRDPQRAGWLGADEREYIVQAREARPPQQAGGATIMRLLGSRSLWALALAQGGFVYEAYMLLSWLPNFLRRSTISRYSVRAPTRRSSTARRCLAALCWRGCPTASSRSRHCGVARGNGWLRSPTCRRCWWRWCQKWTMCG